MTPNIRRSYRGCNPLFNLGKIGFKRFLIFMVYIMNIKNSDRQRQLKKFNKLMKMYEEGKYNRFEYMGDIVLFINDKKKIKNCVNVSLIKMV